MAWEFKREERQFEVVPEGRYRIRIKSAEKAMSKNGNDMLVLQFDVSVCNFGLIIHKHDVMIKRCIISRNIKL